MTFGKATAVVLVKNKQYHKNVACSKYPNCSMTTSKEEVILKGHITVSTYAAQAAVISSGRKKTQVCII